MTSSDRSSNDPSPRRTDPEEILAPTTPDDEEKLARLGHPKGTLAIVLVYMALFVVGWVGLYVFTFLPRGAPDADSAYEHAMEHEHGARTDLHALDEPTPDETTPDEATPDEPTPDEPTPDDEEAP